MTTTPHSRKTQATTYIALDLVYLTPLSSPEGHSRPQIGEAFDRNLQESKKLERMRAREDAEQAEVRAGAR